MDAAPSFVDRSWMDRLDTQGQELLRHCFKSLSRDRSSKTALMIAAMNGFEQGTLALANPASCAERDAHGMTALMLGAKHARRECILAMLPSCDPEARDMDGRTALMHAAFSNPGWLEACGDSLGTVAALMEASDIDAVDHGGWTALMHAASHGRQEVAMMLAEKSNLDYAVGFEQAEWAGCDAVALAKDRWNSDLWAWLAEFAQARRLAQSMMAEIDCAPCGVDAQAARPKRI